MTDACDHPLTEAGRKWIRDVEEKLNADEIAYLDHALARMTPERFERVAQLSPDVAVETLRFELRCDPLYQPLTTREGA